MSRSRQALEQLARGQELALSHVCDLHFSPYTRLRWSSADPSRSWRVVFHSPAVFVVAARSASSDCTGLQCRLPLAHSRLQLLHLTCSTRCLLACLLSSTALTMLVVARSGGFARAFIDHDCELLCLILVHSLTDRQQYTVFVPKSELYWNSTKHVAQRQIMCG